jgi:hypothetical protein
MNDRIGKDRFQKGCRLRGKVERNTLVFVRVKSLLALGDKHEGNGSGYFEITSYFVPSKAEKAVVMSPF